MRKQAVAPNRAPMVMCPRAGSRQVFPDGRRHNRPVASQLEAAMLRSTSRKHLQTTEFTKAHKHTVFVQEQVQGSLAACADGAVDLRMQQVDAPQAPQMPLHHPLAMKFCMLTRI